MRHRRKKNPPGLTLAELELLHAQLRVEQLSGLEPPPSMAIRHVEPEWSDILHRGRYCPAVAALVAEVAGGAAREPAMIRAVLRLSRQYQELRDAALEAARAGRDKSTGW
jgi:hypothetical protein